MDDTINDDINCSIKMYVMMKKSCGSTERFVDTWKVVLHHPVKLVIVICKLGFHNRMEKDKNNNFIMNVDQINS